MVLADRLSHFPSNTNCFPIPLVQNIQHVQLSTADLDIMQGSVECDPVYSTIYHLTPEGGQIKFRMSLTLPDISGVLEMNCPSIMAFSRGLGFAFHLNSLKGPLLICMGHIKVLIGCRLRKERLCIGLA